jgi:aspartate kinase
MERPLVTAVTHSLGDARVTLTSLPDRPGIAGKVLTALAEANVNVDDIIQNEPVSEDHRADMSFTVPKDDLYSAVTALQAIQEELGIGEIAADEHIGKVSLVGAGMKTHPGVAAKAFRTLGDCNVNIEMIVTSPIKISCVIHENDVGEAVRALHTAFDLDDVAQRTEVPE